MHYFSNAPLTAWNVMFKSQQFPLTGDPAKLPSMTPFELSIVIVNMSRALSLAKPSSPLNFTVLDVGNADSWSMIEQHSFVQC
jgi:hypothetical protein